MSETNGGERPAIDGAVLSMLQNHRRGGAVSDLSEAMRDLTEAVEMTGKVGKVVLTLSLRPASKGGALVLEDDIKVSAPKAEGEGSIFFSDDAHNLLREDPKQQTFALRTVAGGKPDEQQPLRKAEGAQ